jgi:hypothetical protein
MLVRTTPMKPRISLDRSIERMRKQLAGLAPYLRNGQAPHSLEVFDVETERLIADLLGETAELLDAYAYAEMGEAAGLVNITDEAPEGSGMDSQRQSYRGAACWKAACRSWKRAGPRSPRGSGPAGRC